MSDPNSSSLSLSSESMDVKGGAVTAHSSRSRRSSGTPNQEDGPQEQNKFQP